MLTTFFSLSEMAMFRLIGNEIDISLRNLLSLVKFMTQRKEEDYRLPGGFHQLCGVLFPSIESRFVRRDCLETIRTRIARLESVEPNSLWSWIQKYKNITPAGSLRVVNKQGKPYFAYWGSGGPASLEFFEIRALDEMSDRSGIVHTTMVNFGSTKAENYYKHIDPVRESVSVSYTWNEKNEDSIGISMNNLTDRISFCIASLRSPPQQTFEVYDYSSGEQLQKTIPLSHKEEINDHFQNLQGNGRGECHITYRTISINLPQFWRGIRNDEPGLSLVVPTNLEFTMESAPLVKS